MLRFEWSRAKERRNIVKHGVSFGEAQSVFFDDRAVQYYDDDRSHREERYLMLGMSMKLRILLVVHSERDGGETIRIISARKAAPGERKHYLRDKP